MTQHLRLEAVLDLQATGRLSAALNQGPLPIELDGSEVSHLGALAAQLLMAAKQAGAAAVSTPSPALLEGLSRLGIAPELILAGGTR